MFLNSNITIHDEPRKYNTKASEEYIHVTFYFPDVDSYWDGWIPVEYRRTGISIPNNDIEKLYDYLNSLYIQMHPSNWKLWNIQQENYWVNTKSKETKEIFNILKDGQWHCRNCEISNPNFARRIQDIKEKGYTVSTHINYNCPVCGNKRSTRLQLLPINRVEIAGNGYETWSPQLRKRIIQLLNSIDVYEGKYSPHCLPDHKFPEIRWGIDTKAENPDTMTDDEIKTKFQLLTNQRNLQKREICRHCYQTGQRGIIFNIPFYYSGSAIWDHNIPKKGKAAEQGCIGCPWYDIAEWKKHIFNYLSQQ